MLESSRQDFLSLRKSCHEQTSTLFAWWRPSYIVTQHVITLSSWVNHRRVFHCKEALHNRADKDVERTSVKLLQSNPKWNDTFSTQLFSKVAWKYALCMDFYHILIYFSLLLTLCRTSSMSLSCIHQRWVYHLYSTQRTRLSAPLRSFRINIAASRQYSSWRKVCT